MSKLKIGFDQEAYNNQVNAINDFAQIIFDAEKELIKQKVKGFKAENLVNGGFLNAFHSYHKSEHAKSAYNDFPYVKYLENMMVETVELEKLKEKYNLYANRTIELFDYNNAFFRYAKAQKSNNSDLAKAFEKSPYQKSYKYLDFLQIKGNKAKINLPTKPYEIHALNRKQISLMTDVREFVDRGKMIGATYDDIWPLVRKYVYDSRGSILRDNKHGLSHDLNHVIFDHRKILVTNL